VETSDEARGIAAMIGVGSPPDPIPCRHRRRRHYARVCLAAPPPTAVRGLTPQPCPAAGTIAPAGRRPFAPGGCRTA